MVRVRPPRAGRASLGDLVQVHWQVGGSRKRDGCGKIKQMSGVWSGDPLLASYFSTSVLFYAGSAR